MTWQPPVPSPPHVRRQFAAVALVVALVAAARASTAAELAPPPADVAQAARPKAPKVDKVEAFFTRGPIPRLRIELSPEDLNKLRQNGREYVPATVREQADGQPDADV